MNLIYKPILVVDKNREKRRAAIPDSVALNLIE